MKYSDREITSISTLLTFLENDGINSNNIPRWFRGQTSLGWHLEPKFSRLCKLGQSRPEWDLIGRFKQNAVLLLESKPDNDFDWLFLMQHYGAPTRLLNWSESPLIALWFAVNDDSTPNDDACLWCLLPTELNKKARFAPEYENSIPSFSDDALSPYSPSSLQQEPRTKLFPMAAIAARNSRRIQAQQGVFTISHRAEGGVEKLPDPDNADHIWRFTIPSSCKKTIQKELVTLGFTKFQIFPELSQAMDGY